MCAQNGFYMREISFFSGIIKEACNGKCDGLFKLFQLSSFEIITHLYMRTGLLGCWGWIFSGLLDYLKLQDENGPFLRLRKWTFGALFVVNFVWYWWVFLQAFLNIFFAYLLWLKFYEQVWNQWLVLISYCAKRTWGTRPISGFVKGIKKQLYTF